MGCLSLIYGIFTHFILLLTLYDHVFYEISAPSMSTLTVTVPSFVLLVRVPSACCSPVIPSGDGACTNAVPDAFTIRTGRRHDAAAPVYQFFVVLFFAGLVVIFVLRSAVDRSGLWRRVAVAWSSGGGVFVGRRVGVGVVFFFVVLHAAAGARWGHRLE